MLNAIDIACMAFACLFFVIKLKKLVKLCTKCAQFSKNCLNYFMVIIMDDLYNFSESTLNIDGRNPMIFNLAKRFPCLISIFPDPLCVDS